MYDSTGTTLVGGVTFGGIELVDHGAGELPGGDSLFEEDIEFTISPSLGFGETVVSPDDTHDTGDGPDESGFGTQVQLVRVQEVRVDDTDDQTSDVVQVSGEDDGLGTETGGSDLGDQGVTDGTDGQIVSTGEDDEQGADSVVLSGTSALVETQTTDDEHDDEQGDFSPQIKSSSTGELHDEPRGNGSDTSDDEHDQVEGRGGGGRKTGESQEIGGVTHQRRSTSGLDEPDETSDLSSSKVDTLETVPELNTDFLGDFELVGVVHHGDLLLGVLLGESGVSGGQSHQGLFGILEPSLSGQPPWGFRSEDNTDTDWDGPQPLDGEGDLVGPFGLVVNQSPVDTGRDDLSDNPTQVDVSRKVLSKSDGHDFSGVGDGHGLESTPRETKQQVTGEKHGKVDGEELDEQETSQTDEGDKHGESVSEHFRCNTGDLETENVSDLGRDTQSCLPSGGDLVALGFLVVFTELLGESGLSVELTQEQGVITFHDNGRGEDDGPDHGRLVLSERGLEVLVLLLSDGVDGILEIGVGTFFLFAACSTVTEFFSNGMVTVLRVDLVFLIVEARHCDSVS